MHCFYFWKHKQYLSGVKMLLLLLLLTGYYPLAEPLCFPAGNTTGGRQTLRPDLTGHALSTRRSMTQGAAAAMEKRIYTVEAEV